MWLNAIKLISKPSFDIQSAKLDIRRFIEDDKVLDIWSRDYFRLLSEKIKFTEETLL